MSRPKKKTAPSKMSTKTLIDNHEILDDLISGGTSKIRELQEKQLALTSAKVRKCSLKTEIQGRAMKGDQEAIDYAKERRWQAEYGRQAA